MSRYHHNAYSQQQYHHAHQNSWFLSPNLVNNLFCSPGNNSSANFNNTFLNGSNINNNLTNLLNAQHHFIPPSQLSNSQHPNSPQPSISGGNNFVSHYHGNHQAFNSQSYSSIFPLNNTYSNSGNGSGNRFMAGQNNHHYQGSSHYPRSVHSNRGSRANVNSNSINPEANHSRRYQSGCNSNGPLITYPNSVVNNKSLNMNFDYNMFNDNSRSISSNIPYYQNKDSKSPNNNNNYNSNMKYNAGSKLPNTDCEGLNQTITDSITASDLHQNSKLANRHHRVKGMENIKLDNEGIHSNYVQFSGMMSKSHSMTPNYELYPDSKSLDLSSNIKEISDRGNNLKFNSNHNSTEFSNYQSPIVDITIGSLDSCKSKDLQNQKKIKSDSGDDEKKNAAKFMLNIDEDELVYYDDDIVEITRFESENNEHISSLLDEKKVVQEYCQKAGSIVTQINVDTTIKQLKSIDEIDYGSGVDGNKKKKLSTKSKTSTVVHSPDSVKTSNSNSQINLGSLPSSSNIDLTNRESQLNPHYPSQIINPYPANNAHFPNSNLLSTIPLQNFPGYSSQTVPNFAMNCPMLSNPGNNMRAAAYIASALGGNHPPIFSNHNPKCSIFRQDNLTLNSSGYHDIVSSKLWQYYITNRQTEAMYVRKVQLRNALHMVMSYVFENAGLFIVGSSMNGFGSDNSDMDLCLTITSKELHQKREAFVVLNQLVEPLRKCSFIKNLQLIRATVPILKFRDALAGVDCDLNINNVVGIYNTHLLAMYNRIDWRVRPLGMYIKHWAQKLDIHDASRGRLSTYTIILMIIQYLQAGCQPPVLPSLQAKFQKNFSYDRQVKEVDMRLELPWDELRSTNTTRLSDLLLGFFEYYVEKFDFSRMAVSIRTGKPIPIDVAIKQLPPHEQLHNVKSFKMFIEEPFSLTNVARSLFDGLVFSRIKRCFRHSLQVMRMKQSLKCMFSLPTPSNSSIASSTPNPDNPDQTRSTINTSPTTSNSTQDESSKIVPVSEIVDNDNSEKSDFKDDASYSDDNKSFGKHRITSYDFEEDDTSISGIIS